MESRLRDIRQLADLLESEAAGRPIDRLKAHSLAQSLAERHPDIRHSMGLICDRMGGRPGESRG